MTDWTKASSALRSQWRWVGLVVVPMVGSVLLLTRLTGATTVLEKSFSSLVQDAEVIAVGTVTAIETEWNPQKQAPFTLVTFSDLEVLKGEAGQTELTLHFLGGPTPDGLIMQIAGVPQFSLGERSVVFCAGNQQSMAPLVGLWQGMYRVVFDAERGIETIHNHARQPVTTLPIGPTSEGGILTHNHAVQEQKDGPQEAMPLDTFTRLIEQALRHGQ